MWTLKVKEIYMYTAPVFFVIHQFTGDASGMLRGDVGMYASEADAAVDGPAPPPIGAKELCRIVINTNTVHGEDPIVTIGNALKAKFPEGAMTEVTS